MIFNTHRNRKVLAGIAGVNLALAVAVSAGAVPRPGTNDEGRSVRTVASASAPEEVVSSVRQPGNGDGAAASAAGALATSPTSAGPVATVPGSTTTPSTAAPTVAATTAAPSPVKGAAPTTAAAARTTVPAVTLPPVTVPAVPVVVARRVPSAAEVQQAITTLPQYVRSILKPSPAQVAQLGDQVCGLFDQGQTFTQVKATGLQMVTQVPLTTVLPGGADWVVRTVVTLYCPGHLAKIV